MKHKVPIESKGFDRILKFFSYKALGFSIVGCLIGLPIIFTGKSIITFIIGAIIIGTFLTLGMAKIPEDLHLYNADAELSAVVFNLIKNDLKKFYM